ncbi:MAG: 1-acyl-sn-glycerol-3-phosphate acyltransferase [Deltaproteobacteria bacterium]|nr:1-acyl-sn-glycerol-3-phosphate acyltransferase [Deltaproteobacteria bacterium]
MPGSVTLPVWLFAVLVLLAVFAAVDRLLIPSVRWYLQRRVGRFIEGISKRLHLEIQPFALTKREVLIDRLMYDPKVLEAAGVRSREHGLPRDVVMAEVERYSREIVPSFNAYAYFRVGYWLARKTARILYRVRVGFTDEAGLTGIDPKSSVVFVMNHRSNMDYILVAYLAATRTALSYAVGEWARIWPLQMLIRSLGAYFIRRNSGDPLYRLVLERYVHMATEGGVVQAIYPEGGLSRDGSLRPPKLGLLDYMLRSFNPEGGRDLVFIPVGINYDRTLEDRSLLRELDPAARKKRLLFVIGTASRFVLRNLALLLRGRWHRFGYACVNFGSPVSMKGYCRNRGIDFRTLGKEERFWRVEELARDLMAEVGKVIPVLPVSLVASALLRRQGKRISELELKAEVHRLVRALAAKGAHIYVPRKDQDYAVAVGLRMLTLRHLAGEEDGLYFIMPGETPLAQYYANAIGHLLPDPPAGAPDG